MCAFVGLHQEMFSHFLLGCEERGRMNFTVLQIICVCVALDVALQGMQKLIMIDEIKDDEHIIIKVFAE